MFNYEFVLLNVYNIFMFIILLYIIHYIEHICINFIYIILLVHLLYTYIHIMSILPHY